MIGKSKEHDVSYSHSVTNTNVATHDTNERHKIIVAQRYREFRLRALKEDPAAFASLYEEERKRGLEHSISRLNNPAATHLIALEQGTSGPEDDHDFARTMSAVQHAWIGMIVLLGPQDRPPGISAKADSFAGMTTLSQEDIPGLPQELYFHLTGTFVAATARGSGVGKALVNEALAIAQGKARSKKAGMVCTVLVDAENVAASRLYASCGFEAVEQQTYAKRIVLGDTIEERQRIAVLMRRREGQVEIGSHG